MMKTSWRIGAAVVVATVLGSLPALAADRDDGYPVPQPPPGAYQPSYKDAPPHQSYKDDAPPRRVAECLSKYGIRNALNSQGWHEFDNVDIRGDVTFMTARNDSGGRRFEVRFDTCTGQVIDAHPRVVVVDPPPPGYYEPRYYAERRYYYEPRPAIGVYIGGGGGWRHRW